MHDSLMLHAHFSALEVMTSILIAILASYAALTLSARVGSRTGTARLPWLIGGGFSVGLGIAGMHFVGMLAMKLPVRVTYDSLLTIISFGVAALASTAALALATGSALRLRTMAFASTAFGIAVSGMHYVGMAAMRGPFEVAHDPGRVVLSIAIAIAASAVAFVLAHRLRDVSGTRGVIYQLASAAVMGSAVAGMHYTAMSAAHFSAAPTPLSVMYEGIDGKDLASLVTIAGLVILSAAITVALFDQRARQAAREAALTNERYREMAEAMPQIVWTARRDGGVDYFNRRWFEYTGRPVNYEESWLEVIYPEDRESARRLWAQAVRSGLPYEIEYRLRRHSNGEYRWHLARAIPLRDAHGEITKWFGTCTDIHEQKRAETILREHQLTLENRITEREAEAEHAMALYQLLAENATDMVSTHNPDGTFEYATPSWLDFLGVLPVGKVPVDFAHPDDFALLFENHKLGFQTLDPITTVWRCRRADGTHGWLETRTRAVTAPGTRRVVTFVCATRDVTQSKRDELALRESEAKYRQLVEQAADAIFLVNADRICLAANARAGAIAAVSPTTLVGQPIDVFMRPADANNTTIAGSDDGTAEFWIQRADGGLVPVETSTAHLSDGQVQIIARDISGRKEVERLKDEFVSVVSHELRTPLTSIRGSLGLLAAATLARAPDKAQRMLSVAVTNTDRLIRLINDILDVERIESGTVAMEQTWCDGFELATSVSEALRPIAEKSGVSLRVSGARARIYADADRVTQTLTNLVGNAIKFSPEDTTVDISVAMEHDGAHFEVRDRGRGIPVDKLEMIFDRFKQVDGSDAREKGGTGLGLAISRSIVRQHGGRIWAENVLGGGSVFKFILPPREEPAADAGAAIDWRDRPTRILVIEDDVELAQVIALALEARGLSVNLAHDGAEAVAVHAASGADVLIVDLSLPDASGLDVLENLRGTVSPATTRTIVYTASDPGPAVRERIRGFGAELATKGRVTTEALVERVIRLLETPLQVA
jgi:PAS domain S-box-containing protein